MDKPFSRPVMMKLKGIDHEVRLVDHEHDEPITMGLMSDKVLKGVKNVEFKYGGTGVEISELLYNMGLLSSEPRTVKGAVIAPMDMVLDLCPPAPKYQDEIKAIIDEGVISEEAAFLVRVEGHREGRPVRIDSYANAPGLVESFELSELSHEAYMTGQCAAVFVKMMVEKVYTEPGVHVPEELNADVRAYCFKELAKLGITVDETVIDTSTANESK